MLLSPLLASLRTAFRSLRRRRRTTLLSIGGLALGVGVCLLAGLYVWTQLSYDRHHEDADRIVRIHEDNGAYTIDDTWLYLADFPGDMAATVLRPTSGVVRGTNRSGAETVNRTNALYYASPSVFDVFTYPLAQGDASSALGDPASIVLSQEAAATHFPDQNPVGRTLTIPSYGEQDAMDLTVSGVMEQLPPTLHVRPDYIVPIDNITDANGETWRWLYLYVRPQGNTTAAQVVTWLNEQRDVRMPRHQHDLVAQPLTDIYLLSDLREEIAPTGNITYVWAFGIVGVLVLLIACINYVNLTTAQVAERMRGVGLRKTFGASRQQVAVHFLAESLLVTGLSVAAGVLLASLAVPGFNQLAPDPISLSRLWSAEGALLLFGVTAVTALLASAYPATYLSGLRPIQLFRGGGGASPTQVALRRGLVVAQFAIAIGLTAVTVIVVQQTNLLADKDLGVDREHTLIVNTRLVDAQDEARGQQLDIIEQRLRQHTGVRAIGRMSMRPNYDGMIYPDNLVMPSNEADTLEARPLIGSEGVTRAIGIPLVAGQRLDEAPEGILINQAAADRLGETAQVGAPIRLNNRYRQLDTTTVVAGILEDFHYQSLRSQIVPTYVRVEDSWRTDGNLFVRAEPGQANAVLEATREAWAAVMPAGTFDYTFMDGEFAQMHRADTQQRNLLLILAGITLFVACLGLIGLVAYLSDRRRAEIGVRKTLGASVASIVGLLSRDVVMGLAVAFVVAVPVAYGAASTWLEQFAYRIDLGPVAFGAAGLVVAVFALGATASQAYRAAQIDPAIAVREE
jgi:putative ABC transport system permease protein